MISHHSRDSFARRLLRLVMPAIGLALFPAAHADPLPSYWQTQREEARVVYRKACEGDRAAMKRVHEELQAGHPVYLNATGWLRSNCDPYRSLSNAEVVENQLRAAQSGYPIALQNYGSRLILKLDDGVPNDPERGVAMLERAVEGGFGTAAELLSKYYAEGTLLPRDIAKARKYLAIAEAEEVEPEIIEQRREAIARAVSEERTKVSAIRPGTSTRCAVSLWHYCGSVEAPSYCDPAYVAYPNITVEHDAKTCAFWVGDRNAGQSLTYDFSANDWRRGSDKEKADALSPENAKAYKAIISEWYEHVRQTHPDCRDQQPSMSLLDGSPEANREKFLQEFVPELDACDMKFSDYDP